MPWCSQFISVLQATDQNPEYNFNDYDYMESSMETQIKDNNPQYIDWFPILSKYILKKKTDSIIISC